MENQGRSAGCLQIERALGLANSLLESIERLAKVEETDYNRVVSIPHADVTQLQATLGIIDKRLKYLANASRPGSINRFPNRVITRIFHILADLPSDSGKGLFPLPSLKWIAITHVCTHWRELALSTASLWTHLLLYANAGGPLIDAFLSRSGDLPLAVTLGQGAKAKPSIPRIQVYRRDLRRVIDEASHRIAKLIVEPGFPIDDILRADRLGQKLTAELSQALPDIIRTTSQSTTPKFSSASTSIHDSLSMLLHSPSARLRHLELGGGPVVAHTLSSGAPFEHLGVLHLVQQGVVHNAESLGLSKALAVLSASKGTLRKLTLVGIPFSDDVNEDSPARAPIALDTLEYLEAGDWPSNEIVGTFLSHLLIPRTALKCIWGDELEEQSSCKFYPHFHSHPEDTRSVVLASAPGGDMIAFHHGNLFINGAIPFTTYSSLFVVPLPSVDKLVLTPLINPLTIEEWSHFFSLLPGIRVIEVRDAEPGRLLRALRRGPGLPHLTELDVQYSDRPWSLEEFDPLGIEYTTEPPGLAGLLCSVASQRHAQSISDPDRPVRRLERVFVRFDARVKAVEEWEAELDAIFDRMREYVGRALYFKRKWGLPDAAEEESERRMEQENKWYLVMKTFRGFWPTKAVYFKHLNGIGKDE